MKQLEAFIAVADMGSFRRAAERLNTTQPNISARIAALESFLGLSLMDRDAGSVRLTPKGVALLPKARGVIQKVDDFLGTSGNDALFQGVLRLGVTETIAHAWLGRFLKALQDRFPNVMVELSMDLSVNLTADLFRRRIDLAIQNGPFDRQSSGRIDLDSHPLVWVGAPSLGLGRRQMSLQDLLAFTILTHASGAAPHEQLLRHLADCGAQAPRLATSTNLAATRRMTIDGLGIACLPGVMVEDDLAVGRLEVVNYAWKPDDLLFSARFDAETCPLFVSAAAKVAAAVAQTTTDIG